VILSNDQQGSFRLKRKKERENEKNLKSLLGKKLPTK
jgi:hypothetical protein